uniref:Lysosomal dipeptide transporter MFSD1 n=1 Tax=Phallusia mammillata TaxID=59560 RepID=A0A6F9DL83_9ASCI|nr:major facilitator superfamily domain-containing protein 1 [Phallusia mammillata]
MHDENSPLLDGAEEPVVKRGRRCNINCGSIRDPTSLSHRLVVLTLMCFLGFGSYFCYDIPAALHTQIRNDMDINEATFMQLYSWYSWPNVILCFFGGFLIDRVLGVRVGCVLFSSFVLVGQLVFALGASVHHIWLMDMGRFIIGIGGESLAVAQNTYAVLWFQGSDLNLVFGLQLSMARIGSTVNMNVMGPVYSWVASFCPSNTLGVSLFLAASTCVFSLICAIVLGLLDKRAERLGARKAQKTDEPIKLTAVKDFPLQLWLIFFICVGYYVAIFPFIGLGKIFFEEKYGFTPAQSSAVNSIVYILSAPCSPVFGFMVDRLGFNVTWVLLAVVATLGSHVILAFTFINPWFSMCLMGVSYSLLACALWPMVAFIVDQCQLGTAYGFMQSIQNLGLAVISLLAGLILDGSGYLMLELFFSACVGVALICTLLLLLVDKVRESGLNYSTKTRDRIAKEQEKSQDTRFDPKSVQGIRNRYYSRIGAQIPEHLFAQTKVSA